jgi:hypothetical protein
MIASIIELTGTQRREDHARDSLAVAGIVEAQHWQTWLLRIALENAGNALSSDCPAVKRGATCPPSIAVPAPEISNDEFTCSTLLSLNLTPEPCARNHRTKISKRRSTSLADEAY